MRETPLDESDGEPLPPRRMFLHEPGWNVRIKTGSHREFCHTIAPGQDAYHRLLNGEVYLIRDDEKLCLNCAARRGLIVSHPKRLRDVIALVPTGDDAVPLDLDPRDARKSHS